MAKETLITDLVSQEAIDQLTRLDTEMEKTLAQFRNCAVELAKGLRITVEVQGDIDKLKDLSSRVMREAGEAARVYQQQLQQQQQVVANTTNTISRQLAEQEKLNKATREAYQADDDALTIARKTLGTRKEHYEQMARLSAQMAQNRRDQRDLNKAEEEGRVTEEEAAGVRARLLESYDRMKYESQQLARLLAVENKEAQAAEGSYQQLSQQLELMKKAYKQMTDEEKQSPAGKTLEKGIQNLDAHLKDLDADMGQFQRNVGNYAVAAESAKSKLRELTNQIVSLTMQYEALDDAEKKEATGQELKSKIQELTEEAGRYKDAVDDVKQSIRGSASDTRLFDTLIESGRLMVSTFGMCSSAAQALGISNDTLQQSMLKVQAAMQAVQALTVIQNAVQKQSNVMKGIAIIQSKAEAAALKIETAARAQETGATLAQTAAMRVFNAVAKANPYVLLATAILTVVGLIIGYTAATKDATEADEAAKKAADMRKDSMESMANSFGQTAGEMIAKYRLMKEQWNALAGDIKGKEQYLKDHKSDFDNLAQAVDGASASMKTVDDVEGLFSKATPDVVKAIQRRATAMAAYAEYIRLTQLELQELEKVSTAKWSVYQAGDKISKEDFQKAGLSLNEEQRKWQNADAEGGYHTTHYELTAEQASKYTAYLRDQAIKSTKDAMFEIAKSFEERKKEMWDIAEKNGAFDPASFRGGAATKTTGNKNSGGNKEQVKEYKELRDEVDKILLESYRTEEQYTDEWLETQKNAINMKAELDTRANNERAVKLKDQLDKSLAAGKMTQEQYEEQVRVLKKATDDVERNIEEKRIADLKKLDDELLKHRQEIAQKQVEAVADAAAAEQALNDATYQQRLTGLYKWYNERIQIAVKEGEDIEAVTEEFNRRKLAIDEQYANETVERQIEALKKELDVAGLSAEEREAIQRELTKATADLAQQRAEQEKNSIEEVVKAEEEAAKKREQALEDWVRKAGEAFSKIGEFMEVMYDNQISKIEEQLDAEQERYDAEINHITWQAEHGAITEEEAEIRKRDAAEQTAKKQEQLEKKKAQYEYKKALMQKVNQVAQIGIATALGIMQALAMYPPNIPLAAFVGAMGALETATALAQPIKAYKEGTGGSPHPGGLAVVGDGDKPEVILYGGRAWVTPDSPTLVNLPKGAEVLPDMERTDLAKMGASLPVNIPRDRMSGQPVIINDYQALEARMADNTKAVTRELRSFRTSMARELKNQRFRKYISERI